MQKTSPLDYQNDDSRTVKAKYSEEINLYSDGSLIILDNVNLPKFKVVLSNNNISLIEALCKSELCKSKGEARRLINGGGARINDQS